MSLIISLTIASTVGTLIGNLSLFWIIGRMAQKAEKKQREELQKFQKGYLEMVQRENNRMKKYAEMES